MTVKIKPTIFIGLGGTGCRICTLLENRISQSKSLPSLAKGKLLQIVGIDSRRSRGGGVFLRNYYGLSIIPQAEDVESMVQNLRDLPKTEADAEFFNEWYGARCSNTRSFVEGCGQDRVNGRLCLQGFMRYYRGDLGPQRLKEFFLGLRRAMALNQDETNGVEVDDSVDVIIFAGAAGGTGSGLVLDTAYLIRSIFAAEGAEAGGLALSRISGVILTDQVLVQDKSIVVDQAYKLSMSKNNSGCLAELDFWGQPAVIKAEGLAYKASWNAYIPKFQDPGKQQPLDDCYIVESTTGKGRGPKTADETYSFVADFFADLFTDSALLTEFAETGSNFDKEIQLWKRASSAALESPHFNRLGRFKLFVPIDAIQDYLVAEVCKEALEKAFEQRHSSPRDAKKFAQNQIAVFMKEHRFAILSDEVLLTKDGSEVKSESPNYLTALADFGDVKEFEKAVKTRAEGIRKYFDSDVNTKVDEWIQNLIGALKNKWIHSFSNFGTPEDKARISARNTVFFLEEIKATLDAMAGGLDAFYPEQIIWGVDKSQTNAWVASFKSFALTRKARGKQAKADAAKWLGSLRLSAHKAYNNRAKAEYIERSRRVVGNLLAQAYAITEQMVRPGSGLKSRMAQEAGQAAQAMSDDANAMKYSLVRHPDELSKFLPDWLSPEEFKQKVQSVYHRWVSGAYGYTVKDSTGTEVSKTYWEDDRQRGFADLLWSLVSHKEEHDVLEYPLGQKAPVELESKRQAALLRFHVQLKEVCRCILNQEWNLDQLDKRLTAWKVLMTFDAKMKTQQEFELAFQQRWLERVAMAECLSSYNPAIGQAGRCSGGEPIQVKKIIFDTESALEAAWSALKPYLNKSDAGSGKKDMAFEQLTKITLKKTEEAQRASSIKPSEIVILNLEGRCFLRNFQRASADVQDLFEKPEVYSGWLDQRFPAWIQLRNKSIPEPDAAVKQRRLRCALAWAWRNLESGSGLSWNRDKQSKGSDVFMVDQEKFEDVAGLFEGLPQHERSWKTVTSNLSRLWKQMGLDARKKALVDAKKQLSSLALKRQDTLKGKRQSLIKDAAETVARLLDEGDEFLAGFTL